jgi:GDSL-like Lipase/Acylhydrolase family
VASDPRHREFIEHALYDEVRFGRRLSEVVLAISIAAAVGLGLLGALLEGTVNLAALALGYAAVCSWLAAACACAYSRFGLRRPWVRIDRLEKRLHAHEYMLLEELQRATERAVEANWRPMRFAAWVAGLAATLTLAAVGSAVIPNLGSAADEPTDPESTLEVSWVVQEPLFIQTPHSFQAPPSDVLVTLRVLDAQRPDCSARYTWQLSSNGVPKPLRAPVTGNCKLSLRLTPEEQYSVLVTRDEPASGAAGEAVVRVENLLVASFGDSVASGEGNPASRKPKWADASDCNRSLIAGPRQAAQLISLASAHSRVVFFHLACTGAWIDGVRAPDAFGAHPSLLPQSGRSDSQTEAFAERYGAYQGQTIVLLSVGANDVGFGPILRFCLKRLSSRCFEKRLRGTEPVEQLMPRRLGELRASYERLAQSSPFRGSRVFVTEYFDPLHNERGEFCRVLFGRLRIGMSVEEAEWAESGILRPLNSVVREQAAAHNWVFVDGVSNAFRDHGYCARASWVVPIVRAYLRGNKTGPFHPNALGQQAYGHSIFQAVKPHLPP